MKRTTLFIIALLSLTTLNAQERLIKISPFHFSDATFNISVEKSMKSDYTLNFSGGVHLLEDGWDARDEKGVTSEIQLRKYVLSFRNSESKLNGIYVAPFAQISYFRMHNIYRNWIYEYDDVTGDYVGSFLEETNVNASSKSGQAGVVMGVQYIMSDVILVDFFLGGGVQYAVESGNRDRYNDIGSRFYTGVMPKIGFNVGVKL